MVIDWLGELARETLFTRKENSEGKAQCNALCATNSAETAVNFSIARCKPVQFSYQAIGSTIVYQSGTQSICRTSGYFFNFAGVSYRQNGEISLDFESFG